MKTTHPRHWRINGVSATAADVRLVVFHRDRSCLAFQFDRAHSCTNTWGRSHMPDDWSQLTIEHVPSVHSPSDVRRDDPEHCVALCHGSNVGVPSKELRAFCREKLRAKYPVCTG